MLDKLLRPLLIQVPQQPVILNQEQKLKIKLTLAARLILWCGFWAKVQSAPDSFGHVGFARAFRLMYKEITGEAYIHGNQKYETAQTIRRLWRYKQSYLVENILSRSLASNYSIDWPRELFVFFGEVEEFISYLSPNEQSELIFQTIKCDNILYANRTASLCKLQQS